ncbi:hypothetical protein tloyanaT_24980 [Thalassotalea loyana]|uniref:Peptide zinc metalloprotease protein n=1 Tax=Thalassotalea loyana TaxID=280483 RepID=A0ABQ6HHI4_9GAMM|nr:hypothetical protein [Thalassotalea loyana]GLX86245.1 hypothetical protein tloyanaT_24980 [Thalassotalea loyana]
MEQYQVSPDIYIVENENSTPGKEFFVSKGARNFYVSKVIAELLMLLKAGNSISEIVGTLTQNHKVKEEHVVFLLDKKLPELGLISHANTKEKTSDYFEQYIKFAVPVLTEKFVVASSSALKIFYSPVVATLSIILSLVAFAMLFTSEHFSALSWNAVVAFPMLFTPEDYVWLYLMVICSYLIHELGHTSAGARYGAGIDKVGVGVYLIFPVFYSDMSKAWSLSVAKRTVVNVGGSYFQFLFAGCIAFYGAMTGSLIAVFAIYIILNSTILNLSPFLRFDGYWIYSDLFKLPNLRQKSTELVTGLFTDNGQSFLTRVKQAQAEQPALFYYAVGSLFFLTFICYVLASLGIEIVSSAAEIKETLTTQMLAAHSFATYSMVIGRMGYFFILGVAYCVLVVRMCKALLGISTLVRGAK